MIEAEAFLQSAAIEESLDGHIGWLNEHGFVSSCTLRGAITERLRTLPSYVPHTEDEAFFDILRNLIKKGLRGKPRSMAMQYDVIAGSELKGRVEIAIELAGDRIKARKLRKRMR